jgi:hypothetical protein
MATAKYKEVQFSDADIVNLDDFIPASEFNPHNRNRIVRGKGERDLLSEDRA